MSDQKQPAEIVVYEIPDDQPVPLINSPGDTIRFVHFDETVWNGKKLVHVRRIITRGRTEREEKALIVIGFVPESESHAALAIDHGQQKIQVTIPTREEKAMIASDLQQLFEMEVHFYK